MTIDWLTDDETPEDGEYAGKLDRGLSWLGRATGEVDGETEFVASTGSVDRMGDSIDQGSWRLASFRANPVILADHAAPVVGVATKVGIREVDGAKLLGIRVRWDESAVNPVGMLLAHQHRNGFRRAVSVGFLPTEAVNRTDLPDGDPLQAPKGTPRWQAGYLYKRPELLEVSSVAVPANREALQLSLDAQRHADHEQALKQFVQQSVPRSVAAEVLDAVRSDPEVRRAVLGLIYSERATTQPRQPGLDHLWSK